GMQRAAGAGAYMQARAQLAKRPPMGVPVGAPDATSHANPDATAGGSYSGSRPATAAGTALRIGCTTLLLAVLVAVISRLLGGRTALSLTVTPLGVLSFVSIATLVGALGAGFLTTLRTRVIFSSLLPGLLLGAGAALSLVIILPDFGGIALYAPLPALPSYTASVYTSSTLDLALRAIVTLSAFAYVGGLVAKVVTVFR